MELIAVMRTVKFVAYKKKLVRSFKIKEICIQEAEHFSLYITSG